MRSFQMSLAEYAIQNHMEFLLEEYAADNPYSPDSIGYNSTIKVKWICEYDHEEIESPHKRVRRGYCSACGKGRHGSFVQNYPDLLPLWSNNNKLDPNAIPPNYTGFILWKCERGHEWSRRISQQLRSGSCPLCEQKKNALFEFMPELIDEWDAELNSGIDPQTIHAYSNIKHHWFCKNGHRYTASPAELMRRSYRCPVCSSFGYNYPELISEWHPAKNGDKTPYDFLVSSQVTAWFICPCCGNEYPSRIAARAKRKSSRCPNCR